MSTYNNFAKKLGACRSSITKICNNIDTLCQAEQVDLNQIDGQFQTLNDKQQRLECLNNDFEQFLEEIVDDNVVEEQYNKMEDYRTKISISLAKCKTISRSEKSVEHTSINLPKLSLPTFSGDVLSYFDFKESFSVAIGKSKITNIEKFQYLKSVLKGEALTLLDGLLLSDDNYDAALELLDNRYGSKRRVMRAHIRSMIQIAPPNMRNIVSLRGFVDSINKHMRGLKSLNVTSDNYSVFLSEILLSKLPRELKHEWAKLEHDESNVEDLLQIIEKEANLQDIVSSTTDSQTKLIKAETRHNSHRTFISKTDNITCTFCSSSDHKNFSCPNLLKLDPKSRYNLVKSHKLCFNCLKNHFTKDCLSKSFCKICKSKHNTLLHFDNDKNTTSTVQVSHSSKSNKTVLPIVDLPVHTCNGTVVLGALLDSGSDRSFIHIEALSGIDNTFVRQEKLSIQGFGNSPITETCKVVNVNIQLTDSSVFPIDLTVSRKMTRIQNATFELPANIPPEFTISSSNRAIDIIIGSDHFYKFVTGDVKHISDNFKLLKTYFGWVPHGSIKSNFETTSVSSFRCILQSPPCKEDLKQFWDNETEGILPINCPAPEKIEKVPSLNIEFSHGRYSINMPWKENAAITNDYKIASLGQLYSTRNRLLSLRRLDDYNAVFQEYLNDKIIEPCSLDTQPSRFIPHHPVFKTESLTTKLRIVFNASACFPNEKSINDCLHEGDNLFPEILGLLLRFRIHPYAIIGDIKQAFLQIAVKPEDRDYMKFLWFKNPSDLQRNSNNIIAYRFCRVPFGFKSSPFVLNKVIQHHLDSVQQSFPSTCEALKNNIYVDDIILSSPTKNDIIQTKSEAQTIFSQSSMKLHKWNTNVQEINESSSSDSPSVLGLIWHINSDSLSVKHPIVQQISTKRQLASLTCSIFDPLGFLRPLTNNLKILLKQCWDLKLDWDDQLPEHIINKIQDLCKLLGNLTSISVPRWIKFQIGVSSDIIFCGFGDASPKICTAAVYIYLQNENNYDSFLLCSKSRIVPSNAYTIPKLELIAALLNARLMNTVVSHLSLSPEQKFRCFSDSSITLAWIKSNQRNLKRFEQNRVDEIKRLVPPENWFHIPSKQNPADVGTKAKHCNNFQFNSIWWNGPNVSFINNATCEVQETAVCRNSTHTVLETSFFSIVDFSRFSNYSRLLRTICFVLSFIQKLCHKIKSLTAQTLLIRIQQIMSFPNEYNELMNKKEIQSSSKLFALKLFLDSENIMRITGRLQESELPFNTKHPILLSKSHPLTLLIIKHYHQLYLHAGVSSLCNILRKTFWIQQCRRTCKRVVQNCITCRKEKAPPCKEEFPPFPPQRVSTLSMRPFETTGIDFLGPISILQTGEKIYVLLCTCYQIRAVHLECTTSLKSNELKNALCRFIARRGCPNMISSDNAKTFKCVAEEITASHNLKWNFIVERSPWAGGIWERLVRSVKSAIKTTISKHPKTLSDIQTLICCAEYIINSRPITYCTGNEDELLSLSPNDFLLHNGSTFENKQTKTTHEKLLHTLQNNSKIFNTLWKRWQIEYLPILNKNHSSRLGPKFNVGDILLLNEGPIKRHKNLVRVVELIKSRDGKVRSVKLLCKGKILVRPIKLLHHLEIS